MNTTNQPNQHIHTAITQVKRRRGVRFLIGYLLCVIGLFVGCVFVKGWYTALIIFGTIHLGSTLVLFWCLDMAVRHTGAFQEQLMETVWVVRNDRS